MIPPFYATPHISLHNYIWEARIFRELWKEKEIQLSNWLHVNYLQVALKSAAYLIITIQFG